MRSYGPRAPSSPALADTYAGGKGAVDDAVGLARAFVAPLDADTHPVRGRAAGNGLLLCERCHDLSVSGHGSCNERILLSLEPSQLLSVGIRVQLESASVELLDPIDVLVAQSGVGIL